MYWFLALLGLIIQTASFAEWQSQEDAIMGTSVSVQVWHSDPQLGRNLTGDVLAEFRRIERLMSPYIEASELSLLNREAAQKPIKISAELFDLLELSRDFSELTQGAFDITFASVGHHYDYRKGVVPSSDEIQRNLKKIDYRQLQLNPDDRSVRYTEPGVRIDLGGIAKGYAVDRGISLLKNNGIEHALITAGGDSRLLGDHRGRPWHIGVRDPRKPKDMVALLPLVDTAVSTSGDYERYFEQDGVRHHHIISPSTGRSASEVQSVTIIGPNATRTDALSTSVFVLGRTDGLKLIDRLADVEAVVIDAQGLMHYSSGLQDLKP